MTWRLPYLIPFLFSLGIARANWSYFIGQVYRSGTEVVSFCVYTTTILHVTGLSNQVRPSDIITTSVTQTSILLMIYNILIVLTNYYCERVLLINFQIPGFSLRSGGMVCIVKDREEKCLIKIQQGAIEKVTMTSGCIIKTNDIRLTNTCIQTGNDVMLSVNLTYPDSSDMGTWNCSDGNLNDTVTLHNFLKAVDIREFQPIEMTFKCIVHEDCHLSLPLRVLRFRSPITHLRTMDGKKLLRFGYSEPLVILDEEWRRRIVIKEITTYPYLNFLLLDVDISDAGIYYLIGDRFRRRSAAAFIIKITEYPKQPAILLRNHEAESNLGPYELYCVSESKSQPMFTRKKLSFTWRINGHNLTDLQPCFRLSGPILTLCMDVCGLGADDNISVTCTAEEDGLVSNESQPFIVPVYRVISEEPAREVSSQDDGAIQTTGRLVGAFFGSVVTGAILSISLKFLVAKRGGFCKTEHRQEERPTQEDNENTYEAI